VGEGQGSGYSFWTKNLFKKRERKRAKSGEESHKAQLLCPNLEQELGSKRASNPLDTKKRGGREHPLHKGKKSRGARSEPT